jgi:hypothetical protein
MRRRRRRHISPSIRVPAYTWQGAGAYTANDAVGTAWQIARYASVGASAYHGFKRNQSVGWAIAWGLLGGLAPVITPAVALAQGFGKRKPGR